MDGNCWYAGLPLSITAGRAKWRRNKIVMHSVAAGCWLLNTIRHWQQLISIYSGQSNCERVTVAVWGACSSLEQFDIYICTEYMCYEDENDALFSLAKNYHTTQKNGNEKYCFRRNGWQDCMSQEVGDTRGEIDASCQHLNALVSEYCAMGKNCHCFFFYFILIVGALSRQWIVGYERNENTAPAVSTNNSIEKYGK